MYDHICKDRFDNLERMHEETIHILRGSNGNPGMITELHDMRRTHRQFAGVILFIACTVGVQLLHSIYAWIAQLVNRTT